ncbi:MAG TPA: hypothetical protein DEA08_26100 [Planctomycetes bacterium]|nr:hypothetical protein [Planctomycetota bacterium]
MSELADFRLSPRARATLAALAPVVLTDEVESLDVVEDVVDSVELFLRSIPTPVRAGVLVGLHTFEHSARALPRSLGREFSSLPLEQRERHFELWWHSRVGALKQLARGLKMFLTMAYYEHPAKLALLGYDPQQWITKVSAERLERFAEEIRATEEAVLAPAPLREELRREQA